MVSLGIGAAGTFGGSFSSGLPSMGKNRGCFIVKLDMWTVVIEGMSPAVCRLNAYKYMSGSTPRDVWERGFLETWS